MAASLQPDRMAHELRELGMGAGDVVLIHSSLSGLGWVEGGAGPVIDALLTVVGETGTVLFPTLTGTPEDGPDWPPSIDLTTTPCWTGAIPEAARTRPGAIRSVHPTHSVAAIGPRAEDMTNGHHLGQTPCDSVSPYGRLMDQVGKILLLGGVTHASNTTLHSLEERAGAPYHLQDEETDGTVLLEDGKRVIVRNRLHLWRTVHRPQGWTRDFPKVSEPLVRAGFEVHGQVGESRAALISASGMRDVILPMMQDDPLYLLDHDARRAFRYDIVP